VIVLVDVFGIREAFSNPHRRGKSLNRLYCASFLMKEFSDGGKIDGSIVASIVDEDVVMGCAGNPDWGGRLYTARSDRMRKNKRLQSGILLRPAK
jgi:hypothetical protein